MGGLSRIFKGLKKVVKKIGRGIKKVVKKVSKFVKNNIGIVALLV